VDYLTVTLSAISDPTRRAILNRLARGPAPVNELAAPFKITQQAVSKHLLHLQRARLIEKHRRGRQNFCRLNPAPLTEAITWMECCRQEWEERFDRLDAVIEEIKTNKKHE
jgi:DNA-binding transcriptional ArsR family regulator